MAVIVPAAIAAGVGVYNIAQGKKKEKEAKALAAKNVRPAYNIPQGDYDNLRLAQANASQGLSDGSKQIYLDGTQGGLNTALSTILKGGGDVNNASSLFDSYLGGLSNVALADYAAKVQNTHTLMNARYRIGNQEDKSFQVNKYGPYADQQQMIAQLRGQGTQQQQAGLGTVGAAAMSFSKGMADRQTVNEAGKIPAGGHAGSAGSTGGTGDTIVPNSPDQGVQYRNLPQSSVNLGEGYNGGINKTGGSNDNGSSYIPYSTGQQSNGSGNDYGIDISKLNPNDARMVSSVLYGNVV